MQVNELYGNESITIESYLEKCGVENIKVKSVPIEKRLGQENYNNQNCLMKIVEYKNYDNIVVEFQDDYKYKTKKTYRNFINGKIFNPFFPNVKGVGFIGDLKNSTNSIIYNCWVNMLSRCYDENFKRKHPTYQECLVCEEWHNYSNFYKWYKENYYNFNNNERLQLDKDILVKGNKIYSPETCCFVPKRINSLFVKKDANRSEVIGVRRYKNTSKWISRLLKNGKEECLGIYETKEEAFHAYKEAKEIYIKEIADNYKEIIPQKLYNAMYNYQVEITD